MQRILLSARMLFGLAMVLGVVMVGSATPASAHHGARITIHYAQCDPQVQDIFGECHDNRVAGVSFTVAGVTRATDANGVVSWTPGAGARLIVQEEATAQPPGSYVYCSNQVTGEVLQDGPILRKLSITTTAGQEVVCDWYQLIPDDVTPDDVTLSVYKATCPAGYEGEDYYADCYGNTQVGAEFYAYSTKSNFETGGTTDGNGFVTFELPGDLVGDSAVLTEIPVVEVPGGGDPPFAAFCTRNDGQPVDFYYSLVQLDPGGDAYHVGIQGIAPGDEIACDWFSLP